jgi:DNA-binding HxlR family transcriptional regulator
MDTTERCPIETTLNLIAGKWKALILCYLSVGTARFNGIKRAFPLIAQKMLTQQLREMEADGWIDRTVYAQVPPKVEYTLTPFGESVLPVIKVMGASKKTQLQCRGESPGCACRCRS